VSSGVGFLPLTCPAQSRSSDYDDHCQMICGMRDELEQIMEEYDKLCPACLGRADPPILTTTGPDAGRVPTDALVA
jgi:hypothetical protein